MNKDDSVEKNEVIDKIKIFSTNDETLKHLGEMLSNDSSRNILSLLIEDEMTSGELSHKTGLSLSLIIHHLNKMLEADVVSISKITKNSKGQDMKHYHAKPGIIIFSHDASEKTKKSKTFHGSLKRIFKFASIGIAGLVSWFLIDLPKIFKGDLVISSEGSESIFELSGVIVALMIIIAGLIIDKIYTHYKK